MLQFYFAEGKHLRYESNYHYCKDNENYQLLQTDIAQQTLKVVDRSFKSFFNLIQKAKEGLYCFEKIRIPKDLNKEGYFSFCNGAANIGAKSNLNGFTPDRRLGMFGYAIKGKI